MFLWASYWRTTLKTLASYGVADGLTVLQVARPRVFAFIITRTRRGARHRRYQHRSRAPRRAAGRREDAPPHALSNIVQHPTEAKYRQLKTTNAAFQRKCLNHDGARDVLIAAGFVENEGVLTMTPSAKELPVLTGAERALSARLDAIEAAARGPPAAPGMPDLSALMGGGGMPRLMGGRAWATSCRNY